MEKILAQMKTCSDPECKCKIKSVNFFPKDKYKKDGYTSQCADCRNRKLRQKRAEDPERFRLYDQKSYFKHAEEHNLRNKISRYKLVDENIKVTKAKKRSITKWTV